MKVDGNAGVTGADQEIGMAPEAMMMAVEDALTKGDIGSWKGGTLC